MSHTRKHTNKHKEEVPIVERRRRAVFQRRAHIVPLEVGPDVLLAAEALDELVRVHWGRLVNNICLRWRAEADRDASNERYKQQWLRRTGQGQRLAEAWRRSGQSERSQDPWRRVALYVLRELAVRREASANRSRCESYSAE